jgi:hypothetical protein
MAVGMYLHDATSLAAMRAWAAPQRALQDQYG